MAQSEPSVARKDAGRKTSFVSPHTPIATAPVLMGVYRGMLLRRAGQPIAACATDGEARGYMYSIEDDAEWIRTGC